MNPLLTKEGDRGRLLTRRCITSPDPSLVRRGTAVELFIGRRPHLFGAVSKPVLSPVEGGLLAVYRHSLSDVVPVAGIVIAAAVMLWMSIDAHASDQVALPTPESSALLEQLLLRADREALYEDPTWLALLHYETEWVPPRARSAVMTPSFFLSPQGNRDPRAELQATLRGFFDPGAVVRDDEHPQCAFIARRHWLAQRLGFGAKDLPYVECPGYERWRSGLDAHGLTLIFPEAFMNNPASMFGHTLLRVDASTEEGAEELLGSIR
jgi:hypothetical protein